jgi:haloalkane dehalogenase
VHRFEDAGHYVLEDAGAEVVPLVQAFLAANPVTRPVG